MSGMFAMGLSTTSTSPLTHTHIALRSDHFRCNALKRRAFPHSVLFSLLPVFLSSLSSSLPPSFHNSSLLCLFFPLSLFCFLVGFLSC